MQVQVLAEQRLEQILEKDLKFHQIGEVDPREFFADEFTRYVILLQRACYVYRKHFTILARLEDLKRLLWLLQRAGAFLRSGAGDGYPILKINNKGFSNHPFCETYVVLPVVRKDAIERRVELIKSLISEEFPSEIPERICLLKGALILCVRKYELKEHGYICPFNGFPRDYRYLCKELAVVEFYSPRETQEPRWYSNFICPFPPSYDVITGQCLINRFGILSSTYPWLTLRQLGPMGLLWHLLRVFIRMPFKKAREIVRGVNWISYNELPTYGDLFQIAKELGIFIDMRGRFPSKPIPLKIEEIK